VRYRVVVVDDHLVVREGVRAMLDREPDLHVVGEACDGKSAVDAVREHRPDVVVMDVSMATLNGVEATRRIKAAYPNVRVLCFSLFADGHIVTGMLEAGASGYMLKASAHDELATAVRTVAEGKTYLSVAVAGYVVRDYVAHRTANGSKQGRLTRREHEVLQLIAEGHDTAETAALLSISPKTVATHREHIMAKLELHSVAALTTYAIRTGIIATPESRF